MRIGGWLLLIYSGICGRLQSVTCKRYATLGIPLVVFNATLEDRFYSTNPFSTLIAIVAMLNDILVGSIYDRQCVVRRYFDWIGLMAYDLHGQWETFTGMNAALTSRSGESAAQKQLNVVRIAQQFDLRKSYFMSFELTSIHCKSSKILELFYAIVLLYSQNMQDR